MQPMTQTAFEVALTERTSEMLDACTKCGKCVEICPMTGPAGVGSSMLVEWPHARLTPFVGGRHALLLMSRTFEDPALPKQFFSTLSPGVVAGLKLRIFGDLGLVVRGRVHYLLYNVDENRSLG